MIFKRQKRMTVDKNHWFFSSCDDFTSNGNNLYNAVLFRERQIFTAKRKDKNDITPNEQEIINEINKYGKVDILNRKSSFLSYSLLYRVFQDSKNPDYYAKGFPAQTAQHVIMQCVTNWESYIKAVIDWKANPAKYKAKPEMPNYKRKGGRTTITFTNQDCIIKKDAKGQSWVYFPFHKKTPVCIGYTSGVLKEAKIKPVNGVYDLIFTFDVELPDVKLPEKSDRIAAVDFGVNNLMAVTNNIGAPCLLYKGGIVKSINQFSNKNLADIMQTEMKKPDCPKNKKGKPKFVPTERSMSLTTRRNNQIYDYMHQTAVHFIQWCVDNRIDTVVCGVNKGWKQETNTSRTNNQNFIQIPFSYLRNIIKYKCEQLGIIYVEQEESYTSQASFLDNDFIPVYKKGNNKKCKFSGKRAPKRYKGYYKKDGFRGLYKAGDDTIINSDLNGSANILRKAFKDAFENHPMPDFNDVVIIKSVTKEFIVANQIKQLNERRTIISKAKRVRLLKKIA